MYLKNDSATALSQQFLAMLLQDQRLPFRLMLWTIFCLSIT